MFSIDKSLKKILKSSTSGKKVLPPTKPLGKGNSFPAQSFNTNFFKNNKLNLKMPSMKGFNLKKYGGKNDWDFDGVSNKKDCQPRNTMRQDVVLYHVTKKKHLPSIMQSGLYPQKPKSVFGKESEKDPTAVYTYRGSSRFPLIHEATEYMSKTPSETSYLKKRKLFQRHLTEEDIEAHKKEHGKYSRPRLKGDEPAVVEIRLSKKQYDAQKLPPSYGARGHEIPLKGHISPKQIKPVGRKFERRKYNIEARSQNFKRLVEIQEAGQLKEYEERVINKPYRELMGDKDGDGVSNMMDCDPNDATKTGFMHKTTVPAYDYPSEYGLKAKTVYMSPDAYMKFSRQSHHPQGSLSSQKEYDERTVLGHRLTFDEMKKKNPKMTLSRKDHDHYTKSVEEDMDSIKAGLHLKRGVVPSPYIEFSRGKPMGQEGRHRAVAAKEMGYKQIPVRFIENDRDYIKENRGKVWGDRDGDGVSNVMDCDPDDASRQGPFEDKYFRQKQFLDFKKGNEFVVIKEGLVLDEWDDNIEQFKARRYNTSKGELLIYVGLAVDDEGSYTLFETKEKWIGGYPAEKISGFIDNSR